MYRGKILGRECGRRGRQSTNTQTLTQVPKGETDMVTPETEWMIWEEIQDR